MADGQAGAALDEGNYVCPFCGNVWACPGETAEYLEHREKQGGYCAMHYAARTTSAAPAQPCVVEHVDPIDKKAASSQVTRMHRRLNLDESGMIVPRTIPEGGTMKYAGSAWGVSTYCRSGLIMSAEVNTAGEGEPVKTMPLIIKVLDLSATTDLVELEMRIMEMLCARDPPHRALVVDDGAGNLVTGLFVGGSGDEVQLQLDEGEEGAAPRSFPMTSVHRGCWRHPIFYGAYRNRCNFYMEVRVCTR